MTANQLETLLCKPVWDYKDVSSYCGVGSTTAYEIIQDLRGPDPKHKKDGWVENFPKSVKRDAVLAHYGTKPETEMGIAIISKMVMVFLNNLNRMGGEING